MLVGARDLGTPSRSSTAVVNIHVINEPDEAPNFDQELYEVFVEEGAAVGETVITMSAGPGVYFYSILGKYDIQCEVEGGSIWIG